MGNPFLLTERLVLELETAEAVLARIAALSPADQAEISPTGPPRGCSRRAGSRPSARCRIPRTASCTDGNATRRRSDCLTERCTGYDLPRLRATSSVGALVPSARDCSGMREREHREPRCRPVLHCPWRSAAQPVLVYVGRHQPSSLLSTRRMSIEVRTLTNADANKGSIEHTRRARSYLTRVQRQLQALGTRQLSPKPSA